MATKEVDTLIQTQDAEGNQRIHYPITLGDNVLVSDELATALKLAADADPTVNAALSALLAALNNLSPDGVDNAIAVHNADTGAHPELTPTFTETTTLAKLTVGEKLSVLLGKIAKAVTDLISHLANKSNPHGVTAAQAKALPLAGGTMTGNISVKTTNYTSTPVKVTDANTYGQLLQIGAGGDVVIGSGESASAFPTAAGVTGAGEAMHICSDTTISFHSNCNTIANRKTMVYTAAGALVVPEGTDYTTLKARNIALVTTETNPATNGAMTFVYE